VLRNDGLMNIKSIVKHRIDLINCDNLIDDEYYFSEKIILNICFDDLSYD
jgi:hypothetical protein